MAEQLEALERESSRLAATIQVAQARAAAPDSTGAPGGGSPAPSGSGGLVWPVSGPVSSPFGSRWGRLHAGIDIPAPAGTPIGAAAAGTVIYAGWMGGYGNLVVIDHGGGLATAYAHQYSVAKSVGAAVAQGQTIGYVGNTGNSFGNHLHFEVRVNGSPVDPLGYL